MGDANPKINIYNLGSLGVNRVLSPIHKQDGELMQAQNALSGVVSGRDAIKKRWGMTGYNASSFSGPVLSIHTLPFPGFPDPVPPTPGAYVVWAGYSPWLAQYAYVGPTYAATLPGVAPFAGGAPLLQTSAGVYSFLDIIPLINPIIQVVTYDTSDQSTASLSTQSYRGNHGIFYTQDGVEQIEVNEELAGTWRVQVITAAGAISQVGVDGEIEALISPQCNQLGVVRTKSGSICGMLTYGVNAIRYEVGGWTVVEDLMAVGKPLNGYGNGSDGQLLSTTIAVSNNRLLSCIYDNQITADVAKMLKSDDYGDSWSIIKTGTVGNGFIDIVYSNVENNWVIAIEQTATGWDLMVSYDNGDTWTTFKQIGSSDNPYFYGTREYGQTTGSYTGGWSDGTTGEVTIFEVDGAGNYTVVDTFTNTNFLTHTYAYVLVPA